MVRGGEPGGLVIEQGDLEGTGVDSVAACLGDGGGRRGVGVGGVGAEDGDAGCGGS